MTTASLSLGYRTAAHKIKNKIYVVASPKINWKLVYFSMITLCALMLVYYIFMVNQLTKGAYVIKNYNKQVSALLTENKNLEASFAESGFLGDVGQRAQQLSFQKTTNVKYLQILQNSLAEVPKNYER